MPLTAEQIRGLGFVTTDSDGVPATLSGAGGNLIQSNTAAIEARLRNAYSVYEFGAAGNDSTDDHTAIQNAIDAAETTGGTVLVPPGVFRIGTFLEVPSNVEIIGFGDHLIRPIVSGSYATTNAQTGASVKQTTRPIVLVTGDDVSIRGLKVRGDTPDTINDHWDGIYLQNCLRALIDGCRISQIGAATNPDAGGNRSAGVFICRGGGQHVIAQCYIDTIGYECIGIRTTGGGVGIPQHNLIANSVLRDGGAHCLAFQPNVEDNSAANVACINATTWRASGGQGVTLHGPVNSNLSNIYCRTRGSGLNAFDNCRGVNASNITLERFDYTENNVDRGATVRLWVDVAAVVSRGFRGSNIRSISGGGSGTNRRNTVVAGWTDVKIDGLIVDHTAPGSIFEAVRIGQGVESGQPAAGATDVEISGSVTTKSSGTSSICYQIFGTADRVRLSGRCEGNLGVRFSSAAGNACNADLRAMDFAGVSTAGNRIANGNVGDGRYTIRDCRGVTTERRIPATIGNGNTSVTIAHGLTAWRTLAARDFTAGYAGAPNGGGVLSIGTVTATEVTVNCASAVSGDTAIVIVADASERPAA